MAEQEAIKANVGTTSLADIIWVVRKNNLR
jgi:hypothetical protein